MSTGCRCRECIAAMANGEAPPVHRSTWTTPCHSYANGCICPSCSVRAGRLRIVTPGPKSLGEPCRGGYTCPCAACVAERVALMHAARRAA